MQQCGGFFVSYVIVFIGAGLGGALRHGFNLAVLRLFGPDVPIGTFAVNVLGSLAMGLLIGWFTHRTDPGQTWRLFLTTGILGGFTTFSTFSLDAAVLYQRGEIGLAAIYVASSVALSILGLFAGLQIARSAF
jgi:CrcB protein